MKKLLILATALLTSGCLYVNERGIDNHYYNQCKESYDAMGNYHKDCDENLLEYRDVTQGAKNIIKNTQELIQK